MKPKVSIIIPTYNRLPMLKEAVHSVLTQDFEDFELIVVDDGSTDETGEEMKQYGGKVRVLRQDENRGVSAARNRGLLLARGKYIAFLDSDDLWVKGKLKIQVAFLDENPQYPLCYTDEIWIRRGKKVNPMGKHGKYSGWIFEKCLPLCIISPSSAMMRKNLFSKVGLFDEALPVCEDYDFWLRVSARFPVFFISRKLIIKRGGHPDQLSNRSWGNDRYRVIALEKLLSEPYLNTEERGRVLEEMKRKCQILHKGFLKRGNELEARRYQEIMRQYGIEIYDSLQIVNCKFQN
ncbi:MAG: glycosyltransferase [Thermodesulfobacteriota bacterium]|nr:glycosyltransferase [Thermodesulfobacteriota bacterium]